MGHAHDHSRGHHHGHAHGAGAGNARLLLIALALTGTFLLAEVAAAIAFNSLALLSDAAHMFTDTAALAVAYAAVRIGERAADDRRTFGYRRFEILAAAFNAILLFVVAVYVLIEGASRIVEPEPVATLGMLLVAVLGLVVNVIAMRLLTAGKDTSLNVRSAYLEVLADLVGSAGIIVGGVVMLLTGWTWLDPVIAIAIALWVVPRTWVLLRHATNILLEGVPTGMTVAEIRRAILESPGVAGVHDLHVWVLGADQPSCSAHVEIKLDADHEGARAQIVARLKDAFGLAHITLQLEREACADRERLHA